MNGFHAVKSNRCSRQRRGVKAITAAAAKLGDRLATMRRHAPRDVALRASAAHFTEISRRPDRTYGPATN
jgi:hypothetical protein